MTGILPAQGKEFDFTVPVLVVGGGACGLSAALAARDAGAEVLLVERDASLLGTTAMSTGLIPGVGSKQQIAAGIEDSVALFSQDVVAKTKNRTDAALVEALAAESGATIDWLTDTHGVPLSLVTSFRYPGHSALRMHGTPNRTGSELMGALQNAAEAAGVDILTEALVTDLYADADGRITGVRIERPDGGAEEIGCAALILACCGFAGNAEMVAELIPEIKNAVFHGHPGNKGDAIRWGRDLGARIDDITGYQGHGGLAAGHGIPILWPVIMQGGYQVNQTGARFSDESKGYSEQAVDVLAQPGGAVWDIFDARIHEMAKEFDDYQDALKAGAVLSADSIGELAQKTGLPEGPLSRTIKSVEDMCLGEVEDPFGRDFTGTTMLKPPYYAVKVTGALFHTQGGLAVDAGARVLREDGRPFPNLFAGGGAARGVSGDAGYGYLAGNGLWTATTLGRLAGQNAAKLVA